MGLYFGVKPVSYTHLDVYKRQYKGFILQYSTYLRILQTQERNSNIQGGQSADGRYSPQEAVSCIVEDLSLIHIFVLKENIMIFSELCHGCGGCAYFCPEKAIAETSRGIGTLEKGTAFGFDFLHGNLNPGEAMSPPLINAVKSKIDVRKHVLLDAPQMCIRDRSGTGPSGKSWRYQHKSSWVYRA